MTEILCKWLNEDVHLQERINPSNFASAFGSGYLLGELMNKYGLQEDFTSFSPGKNTDAKLNNFSRLEPSLRLLQVPFNSNIVSDVMREKPGAVTSLMYQLFIALNRKEQQNLTSHAMEAMKSSQKMTLETANAEFYQNRLRQQFPRQVQVDIEELVKNFDKKRLDNLDKALNAQKAEDQQNFQLMQSLRQQKMERSRQLNYEQRELIEKLGSSPKPRTKVFDQKVKESQELRRTQISNKIVKDTIKGLDDFESKQNTTSTVMRSGAVMNDFSSYIRGEGGCKDNLVTSKDNRVTVMRPEHNAEYISKIRMRLCDDALARKEREKRRRRVLVEQLAAHEAIEQRKHEDMLVTCLMRQSQLERRIALQLLQVRLEKDVIKNNRLQREQQYMKRRLCDFDEALDHEAEVARLTKLEYEEQCSKELKRHESIAAENKRSKYMKHYNTCRDTLMQMVDLACMAGHYKELSEQPIPIHLWKEWQALFVAGKPFYEDKEVVVSEEEDCEAVTVLNECNMDQYKALAGEWVPPEEHPEITPHLPSQNNFILGHILKRLELIVHPPPKPTTPPQFPEFPIKACLVGKTFAGKSSVLAALSAKKRLKILNIDTLIDEVVGAHNSNETVEVEEVIEAALAVTPSGENVTPPAGGEGDAGEVKEGAATPAAADPPTETPPADATAGEQSPEEAGAPSPGPTLKTITKQVPSPRALLGKAVEQAMTKGKSIPINIMTDIVVLGIREVPQGTGWILDNFPKTLKQAKALEKALSGFTGSDSRGSIMSTPGTGTPRGTPAGSRGTPSPAKLGGKNGAKKGKKNQLVDEPDCDKPAPPPPPVSGLDLVIHLSIPDKVAIKRACGRRKHKDGEEYHEEHRPPPEGSYTGVPPSYDEFNVKHSPSPETVPIEDDAYRQIQPRLVTHQEEWSRMEKWFTMFNNLMTVDAQSPLSNVEEEVEDLLEEALAKKNKPPTPSPSPPPAEEEKALSEISGGEKPPSEGTPAPDEGADPTPAPVPDAVSQEGVPETIPEEPSMSPSPVPGSGEWTYVDEPIPSEAAVVLFPQWELIQDSYLQLCKHTFKKIRGERETIVRYFYSAKKNFLVFLQRPDNKQTFVTSWVKNYNSVAEDMRQDVEMKAELHQTIEDLQEKLWDISDKKKVEAEEERQLIITEQWLEDHIGILTNHYIQLLQAEVDRYQGSARLIKDYYQVLEAKILDEPKKDFIRVPLVELPRTESPQPPSEEKNERSSARSERSKSAGKVQGSPSMQTPGVPATESEENGEPQRRIPLVSRKVQERESRKSGKPPRETPEQDSEEAQIIEAYMSALAVIEQLKQPSQDEEAQGDGKGKAKGKDKGKPKKGKKSASPAATPNAGTPVPELTPEEIARQKMLERANMECAAALLCEERSLNLKLAVVKLRAVTVIKELKERAAKMYEVQHEWIGQRFQKEMDSIKMMVELLGDVIESEKALLPQVLLSDEKFEVDMGYKMFEPPVTPPPDMPIEIPTPDVFTIEQLQDLHSNLKEVAPSGYISLDLLVEMFEPPSFLPEIWQNITVQQLEEIFSRHLCETKYINWRTVLLSCLLPIPLPSQQELIRAAQQYRTTDKEGKGLLSMAEYACSDLWFSGGNIMTPDGTAQFDRLGHLKTTLFSIFCEENYTIDYTDFLLLFSADPEPGNGALKALGMITGTEVEWPTYIETPDPNKDTEDGLSSTGAAVDVPTKQVPITLDQLIRVVSFNRMPTASLKLVQEEVSNVFKEIQGEDGRADVSTLLVHPKGRDIILHTPSYLLVDYRSLLLEAVVQDPKITERVPQPLV